MKYTNVQWKFHSPIYIRKPHKCPSCCALVNPVKQEKIVRAGSEQAKSLGVHGFHGNVKVVWKVFECPGCGRITSIEEMKRYEGIPT